jgi:hypothetical protein
MTAPKATRVSSYISFNDEDIALLSIFMVHFLANMENAIVQEFGTWDSAFRSVLTPTTPNATVTYSRFTSNGMSFEGKFDIRINRSNPDAINITTMSRQEYTKCLQGETVSVIVRVFDRFARLDPTPGVNNKCECGASSVHTGCGTRVHKNIYGFIQTTGRNSNKIGRLSADVNEAANTIDAMTGQYIGREQDVTYC